ncbi:MAG: phage/plasmid primase, P4 family, partial [Culicoidibacterales bacterium]
TRSTSVKPDAEMPTPYFDKFFKQTFQTKDVIDWMGYYFGSCLRGDNKFQIVLFLLGSGNDGKSVLDGIVSDAMGGYSKSMDSVLLDERFVNKETDTKFADLLGVRYAHQQEIQRNAHLNIENFKRMTGGDKVEQRARYNQGSDGRIQASFAIYSNEFYKVDDLSDGTWRRMRTFRIKKREFKRDPDLPEKLKAELGGILYKLIQLAKETYKTDIQELFMEENTPAVMKEYKENLRGNSNIVNMFVATMCVHETGAVPITSKKDLWDTFKIYACDERVRVSNTDFYHALETLGFSEKRTAKMRFYQDLNLKPVHERE